MAVPTITCIPWNPVATKKDEPKMESAMEKVACVYSIICRAVKYAPNIKVTSKNLIDFECMLLIRKL